VGQDSTLSVERRDTLEVAMLSPRVGGLVRTWTNAGSRLWSVADPRGLSSVMGQGLIARTLREERRFREVALLNERTGTLLVQPRKPTAADDRSLQYEGRAVQLAEPGTPRSSVWSDLKEVLGQAVRYTVAVDGFLVVEHGGWDAPLEPFCLFIVVHDQGEMSVLETAPAPRGARFWEDGIKLGEAGATISAPATDETLAVVPTLILDACATWGVEPWDSALTYGRRS
jgi:hypothetical protein